MYDFDVRMEMVPTTTQMVEYTREHGRKGNR